MHLATSVLSVIFSLLVAYVSFSKTKKDDEHTKDFPGPTLIPWIGRIHDLPIDYMWKKFYEWSVTYGPIYKTKMLGASFLIISDEKIAEELLVKRGKIYSDRPQIRSLFDPKSTHGSMSYLPLMGRNGKLSSVHDTVTPLIISRILGSSTQVHSRQSHQSYQQPILWRDGL